MYQNLLQFWHRTEPSSRLKRWLLTMKLISAILFISILQVKAGVYAQKLSIKGKNMPFEQVIKQIRQQSGYDFFYPLDLLKNSKPLNLNIQEKELKNVLDQVFANQPFTYLLTKENKAIIILERPKSELEKIAASFKKITVSGKVVDENDKPLQGANIRIKGTDRLVSSAADGSFELKGVDENAIVIINYIGYQSKELKASIKLGTIQLTPAVNELDNVVVIGYGTVKKDDLTGSVSSIKISDMNKMNVPNLDVALVGRAPGVHVVAASGAPGAIATIRIRGTSSAVGSNEPLYVIDGIPIESGNGFGNDAYANDSRIRLSPLAAINPLDIERIDILKDASSTAIYGSRGANGVVMVTTKRGKGGSKPNINISYSGSGDRYVDVPKMLDATQYHTVVTTAYANAGIALPANFNPYPNANTDWIDLTTRDALSNNLLLNVNGGTPNGATNYSFSGGLTTRLGAMKSTDFKRQTLKGNLTTKLFDKLTFGTNFNLSINESNGSGTGQFYVNAKYRPDIPLYDPAGRYGAAPDSVNSNPVSRMLQPSIIKSQNILSSFFGELQILNGLWLRSTISLMLEKGTNERYTPSFDVFEIRNGRKGSRTDVSYATNNRIFDNTLSYIKQLGRNYLNIVAGTSFTKTRNESTTLQSTGFQDDYVLNNLGSAASIQTYSSNGGISGLSSYFLRGNYNYAAKYYLTFTGRADHSTKFGPKNRWGYFPSGAVSWRISNEEFLKRINFINDLRIRTSYGRTGSANFSDFQYATFFGTGSFYNNTNGAIANTVPNPNIRWEATSQLDAAVEYNLFGNKLRGSIGYFNKKTKDMILNRSIILETGGSTQFANVGDFLNRGWELEIGSDVVNKKDFAFYTDLNLTRYRSKVLALNGGSYSNLRVGQSMGYFTGYKFLGIFQNQSEIDALNAASPTKLYQASGTRPGDFKFADINGDGIVNTGDIDIIGKSEPDFYGGWNNFVRYKNFELTAFFNFSVGNYLANYANRDLYVFSNNNNNYAQKITEAWRADNTSAILPRVVTNDPNRNARDSDYFIENASFFKLKNLQLAYTLRDNAFLKKILLNNIRAFLSLSEVFVITKYKGIDPEVNAAPANNFSQGIDNNVYPVVRTFTFGLTANF